MTHEKGLMIIAGEVSGDMHGARLVKALRRRDPGLRFFGIGGDRMQEAGVELTYHVRDMAVMGLPEVIRRLKFFKHVFSEMLALARKRRPDAVILVDYPGFNLRFAAKAHTLGLRVIYYICPQVWAWNRARIPRMAKVVDRLITIFPFEHKHFAATDLPVEFVGHPLVDEAHKAHAVAPPDLPLECDPTVALLPGSRAQEIARILPIMWSAAALVEKSRPAAGFVIAAPSEEIEDIIHNVLKDLTEGPSRWSTVTNNTPQVLRCARAAMVASGTATLEASLMLCPMVIAYKTAPLTYLMGKLVVRVGHIGMVNIVAGTRLCPEYLQSKATPHALAGAIAPLLTDTAERTKMISGMKKVNQALGPRGAEDRAAQIVLDALSP